MKIARESIKVVNNPEKKRFEVVVDAHTAVAEYILTKDRIIFTHTEVPKALEGNGIGAALASTGLNHAKEQGLKVMPLCPFIASYIRKHPEYRALLAAGINV